MFICICKGIRESDVQELGRVGITCPKKLTSSLELNDKKNCCGRCIKNISKFVALAEVEYSCSQSPVLSWASPYRRKRTLLPPQSVRNPSFLWKTHTPYPNYFPSSFLILAHSKTMNEPCFPLQMLIPQNLIARAPIPCHHIQPLTPNSTLKMIRTI